jgi:hypothetical protein
VKSVKMRIRLTTYFVSAPLFSIALVADLIDREKSSWTALQQHDKQAWKSLLFDTYSQVNSSGIRMGWQALQLVD